MAGAYKGYASRNQYEKARAIEQGYSGRYERSLIAKITRDLGIRKEHDPLLPKDVAVNVIQQRQVEISETRQRETTARDWFFGSHPWNLEIHPYTNSVHYVYSFELTEANIWEANRAYLEIVERHMRDEGSYQVRIYGQQTDYATGNPEPSGEQHWRGLPGIDTREFIRQFPTVAHVTNQVGTYNPERMEIIYIASKP